MIVKVIRGVIRTLAKITTVGFKTGYNPTRYYAYRHLSSHQKKQPENAKCLSVSGSQNLCKLLGFSDSQITNVEYPDANILDLPFGDQEFDAVVSDQVLEHVEGNPCDAINEVFRVLKPNGISLQATCLMVPIHASPNDFWRFTPEGLKELCKMKGQVLDSGGWGNPAYVLLADLGLRFIPVPHCRFHPIHLLATWNDKTWPVFTWVLCKKNKPEL